jgi:hypothetical protein
MFHVKHFNKLKTKNAKLRKVFHVKHFDNEKLKMRN